MNIIKAITMTLLVCLLLMACSRQQSTTQSITLRFMPYVGHQPLVFNEYRYANPGSEGHYKIRDFQLYISNLRLLGSGKIHRVRDSYHLVRFDNDAGYYEINLTVKDPEQYSQITIGIGVDERANGTILNVGDLDPNSRMAWSWDVGYKFILLEGFLRKTNENTPLVYHIGFNENYKELTLPITLEASSGVSQLRNFKVDVLSLFTAQGSIDLSELSSVKFDKQDAKRIASGFDKLIQRCNKQCS